MKQMRSGILPKLYIVTRIGVALSAPFLYGAVLHTFPFWAKILSGALLLTAACTTIQTIVHLLMGKSKALRITQVTAFVLLAAAWGSIGILSGSVPLIAILLLLLLVELLWTIFIHKASPIAPQPNEEL